MDFSDIQKYLEEISKRKYGESGTGYGEYLNKRYERLYAAQRYAMGFDLPNSGKNEQGFVGALDNIIGKVFGATTTPQAALKRISSNSDKLDKSEKRQIAIWMAKIAILNGLPPELPVMAALVESSLSNLTYGDRDSQGFFQIRTSIHGSTVIETPESQLLWFINRAKAPNKISGVLKSHTYQKLMGEVNDARSRGDISSLATWLGMWAQDVERSAFPDRYKERYTEAVKLLNG